MPKAGSSMMEKKAKSAKRQLKKLHKSSKRKRKNDSDEDSDIEDYKELAFMPTPSQQLAIENGASVSSLKKKKKKKVIKDENTQTSIKKLAASIFSDLQPIQKVFWEENSHDHHDHHLQRPTGEELKLLRKSIAVNVKGTLADKVPSPILTLTDPCIPSSFVKVFQQLNFSTLTPVQMQGWPAILAGQNILAIAPTGSGKTFCYGLCLEPHISYQLKKTNNNNNNNNNNSSSSSTTASSKSPIGLILVPTRELAIQVASALKVLKKLFGIKTVPVYGGQDREEQLNALFMNGTTHVIVATPGRLLDLLASKQLNLLKVSYFVLDEADRMLNMGFFDQLNTISSHIRSDRQSLLFSATFPGKLREAADTWVPNGVTIRCSTFELDDRENSNKSINNTNDKMSNENNQSRHDENKDHDHDDRNQTELINTTQELTTNKPMTSSSSSSSSYLSSLTISKSITQHVHVCASHKKPRLLIKYLEKIRSEEKEKKIRQPESVLIFCTKIKTLNYIVEFLRKNQFKVEAIHGKMPQNQRERALNDFKAGKSSTLCATDVAARGIHIKRLKHVINYDFPISLDQYCHRVGRTGRQDEAGTSYSLISRNMAPLANDLITLLKSCGQDIEANLQLLAADYAEGKIDLSKEEAVDTTTDEM